MPSAECSSRKVRALVATSCRSCTADRQRCELPRMVTANVGYRPARNDIPAGIVSFLTISFSNEKVPALRPRWGGRIDRAPLALAVFGTSYYDG